MFSKYISILAATAAVAFAYTQPTTQCTDGCNPVRHPGLQEAVPKGTTYTITWDATTAGTLTILLLRGPAENVLPLFPIAEKIPNTGAYLWNVPTSLTSDTTHYGIQLINDADGTYQYSNQFGISGADVASSSAVYASSVASSVASSASSVASSASSVLSSASSVAASASSVASLASSAASNASASYASVTSAIKNATSTLVVGTAASTGFATNSTILSASPSISKPTSLQTAAATSASSTGAAPSTPASGAVYSAKMSLGGAVIALLAAVVAI